MECYPAGICIGGGGAGLRDCIMCMPGGLGGGIGRPPLLGLEYCM
ncbi:hypothetical protein A2U01_0065088, partial [Trifolium medium]|nr:hypothetical protein [Trifolium medium]